MLTIEEQTRELYEHDDLPEGLRWIDSLSRRHQRIFYGEIQLVWSKFCLTKDQSALVEFFDDWRATAEADESAEHSAYLLKGEADDEYEEWQSKAVG